MRPRHECLPFGGPHRHGIHYSTSTPGKSPDRAKIPQEKAPEPTSPLDISPPPDTMDGAMKHMTNRATAKRNRPAYSLSKRSDKKRETMRMTRAGASCQEN